MHDYPGSVLAETARNDQMDHGRHGVAETMHRQRGPVTRHRVRARPQARLDHILKGCGREFTQPVNPMRRPLHHTRRGESGQLLAGDTGLDRVGGTEPAVTRFSDPEQHAPARWHECHHIVDEHATPTLALESRISSGSHFVGSNNGAVTADVVSILERPVYGVAQAAGLLGLRRDRTRAWLDGYEHHGVRYAPVIRESHTGDDIVTWGEFVELGYLREYRRRGLPLQRLRPVIDELRREFATPYPLATPWADRSVPGTQPACWPRTPKAAVARSDRGNPTRYLPGV